MNEMGKLGWSRFESLRLALLVAAIIPSLGMFASQHAGPGAEPVPCAAPSTACSECHTNAAEVSGVKVPSGACSQYCMTCHKELARHHKVGMTIKGGARLQLRLNSRRQVACTTCHNLDAPRHDSVPWKCQSLFDSVFRRAASYRTYYLVARNNTGELCRNCH
jgi:hypothetical protein